MQTTDLEHAQRGDIISEFYHEWASEIKELLGIWKNVNPKTGQIARLEVISKNDTIFLHCYGKLEIGEKDWGQSPCELFSSNVGSSEIEGFISTFEFDFMKIQVAVNIKYGVMVVQSYNTFKDGSNRNNYFSREFFCK
ncbi:hypothetical protein [Aquimarina sediminis]|uniref:hypothetical protein n=1 Tax=Aquimarina sediminis TaxID=2070536 RepID=UPI000CA0486A|nr:hypothetical protein [Aquimarina sediminis]